MRPISHVTISLATSVLIYAWFRSLLAAVICFLSGILLDLDHILEYLTLKERKLSLKIFYYSDLAKEKERLYLIFHSFELILFLWWTIHKFSLNLFWIAFAIGISTHLILDLIRNPVKSPLTYFLFYRLIKGFSVQHLFDMEKVKANLHK